jgi:hypothetical protein
MDASAENQFRKDAMRRNLVNRHQTSIRLHRFAGIAIVCILVLLTNMSELLRALPPGQTPGAGSSATSNGATSSFVDPPRDAQAISILNQVLTAGGGAQAIVAVSDYTATGNIVTGDDKGTVTLRGLHGWEFRMDISDSTGSHSTGVHQGKLFTKAIDGKVDIPQHHSNTDQFALPVWTPLYPAGYAFQSAFVAHVVGGKALGVSMVGTSEINGHSVYDIRISTGPFTTESQPGSKNLPTRPSRDLFIDTSTFQIVAFRETVPRSPTHEVDYDNYRPVNGVLMPFTIAESYGGQTVATIQIDQITFNSGLALSAFSVE